MTIRVLTIDGGGLQALTTLSILNDVCEAIAKRNKSELVPAPCELFDVIGGIGTGGWLALLLGRFRLNIVTCMSVYMEIANAIDPQSGPRAYYSKPNSSSYRLDQKRLMAKIDQILRRYGQDLYLLDQKAEEEVAGKRIRCKYAFAAAAIEKPQVGGRRYEVFRTYESTSRDKGSPDPAHCKISEACAATGAAKYILPPHRIGSTVFCDTNFPNPHQISSLALDEVYSIYGPNPTLSLILNVGPGIPSQKDFNSLAAKPDLRIIRLARKFSWPRINGIRNRGGTKGEADLSATSTATLSQYNLREQPTRSDTVSSESSQASETEQKFEDDIRDRLAKSKLPGGRRIYHRLGPERAPDTLALNDVSVVDLSTQEVDKFLGKEDTKKLVKEVVGQYWVEAQV